MAGKNKNSKTAIVLRSMDSQAELIKRLAEEGKTLGEIGKELGGVPSQDVSRWLRRKDNVDWWTEVKQAKAHVNVDEAKALLRKATTKNIRVKSELAKILLWESERLDRATYGSGPAVAVQVNITEAFVQALRQGEPSINWLGQEAVESEKNTEG
jgi:hypothetical protein